MNDTPWWNRFTHAASSLWDRIAEEAGLTDVAEELHRFDTPDMTVTDWIRNIARNAGGITWQAKDLLVTPFAVPATELNRVGGQAITSAIDNPKTLIRDAGLPGFLYGLANPQIRAASLNTAQTYATGGMTPQLEAQMRASGVPQSQIDSYYGPVSASDAITVGVDKLRNRFGLPAVALAGPFGAVYAAAGVFNPTKGGWSNGSYLPAAFDLTTPDAGYQLWTSSGMTHQLIGEQLLTESVIDPMNWAAAPISAFLKGIKAPALVRGTAALPDTAQAFTDIADPAIQANRRVRGSQWMPGRGQWSPAQMLDAMVNNRGARRTLEQLAAEESPAVIRSMLERTGMANTKGSMATGEGLDAMTSLLARADTPERVAKVLYAGAFRDKTALKEVLTDLESQVDTMPAAQALRTLTGTGPNILEKSIFEYGADGELPTSHPLNLGGQAWVAEAIRRADAAAGLAPDDPAALAARWQALSRSKRLDIEADIDRHAAALESAGRLLKQGTEAGSVPEQLITRMPRSGFTSRQISQSLLSPADRAAYRTSGVAKLLEGWSTPAIRVRGKTLRTSPSVWLMARPGLTFDLHGADAGAKFDGIIKYVDGVLGSGGFPVTDASGAVRRVRFADDPRVLALRERFALSGAITRSPEQLRADLVDQLQELAVSAIGRKNGVAYEAADLLARRGMLKAGALARALNDLDRGYTTALLENGQSEILTNHPGTVRQSANHIPLMDLKALDDAFRTSGIRALLNPNELLSVATMKDLISTAEGTAGVGMSGEQVLDRIGRGRLARGTHTIIDLADAANTLFKKSVLLRLGYPVRNLAEAHLSAIASGHGWLKMLAAAHLPTLLSNFGINLITTIPRRIDRFATWAGLVKDDEVFIAAANDLVRALEQSSANISMLLDTVTDPVEINRLVKRARSTDPAKAAQAAAELTYLTDLRLRALHQVDPKLGIGDPLDHADGSGVFFHADSTGRLAGLDHTGVDRLDGPLAVTNDRVVARNAVDFAWGDPGRWQDADITVPGAMAGGVRVPGLSITPARQQLLADLWAEGHATGQIPPWRIGQSGDLVIPSEKAAQELQADLAAKRASAPSQAVPATPFTPTQHSRYLYQRMEDQVHDALRWHAHQRRLRTLARDHHVQYRVDPTGPWTDWTGYLPIRGSARARGAYEFRTSPKHPDNPKGKPGVVQLDVWGPGVDLTDQAVLAEVMDKYGDRIDAATLNAAHLGDRAAQRRLSDVLAKEGIYRIWLPDSAEWNGEMALIHPDGIGPKAYRRYLDAHVRAQIAAGVVQDVPVDLLEGLTRMQTRALNRGRMKDIPGGSAIVPEHVNPSLAQILQQGGIEDLLKEHVDQVANLRSQLDTVNAALVARQATNRKWAKRRGVPETVWKIAGRYRTYQVHDALHGPDGAAYAEVASGNLNHANTYARGAHAADLLSDLDRGVLQPQEIHPGDPRYWEALANLLARHYRDTPGVKQPEGSWAYRDIDPLFAKALQSGDRARLQAEAVDWALTTAEGREWVRSLGLKTQSSSEKAVAAGEKAAARRGVPPVTAADINEALVRDWRSRMGQPTLVKDVDVADVIAAQFNFAENWVLPNPEVKKLFLRGEATPQALRDAYQANPWELHTFNGLLSPTDAATRRVMRARADADNSMGKFIRSLNRFGDSALNKIGSGPETRLARHPMFSAIARTDLAQRVRFAETTLGRELTMEEVLKLRSSSQKFALREMEATLYTLKNRSAVDDFLRFVGPFFPAWRNTLHRWGRFSLENPGGVSKVSRFYDTTVNQMGWYDFQSGEQVDIESVDPKDAYTLLPGVTALPVLGPWLKKQDPVLAQALRRTKVSPRSLDVVFQGEVANPSVGPWVAAPAQWILDHQSQIKDSPMGRALARYLLPAGPNQTGSSSLDMAVAFLPSALKVQVARTFHTQQWVSTVNKVAATYYANGYDLDASGQPKPLEQVRAEIDSAVAKMMTIKTLMYLVSPVSAQQVGDAEYYAGQMRSLRDTMPTIDQAESAFLERFGARNFFYTQSSTFNLTGGMSLSQVVKNQKQLDQVSAEAIDHFDNPKLLAFFENMGPNGERLNYTDYDFNEYARNWQLKNSPTPSSGPYRGGKSPEDSIRDAKVRLGWRYFDSMMSLIDTKLQTDGYVSGTAEFYKERARRTPNVTALVGQLVPEWENARSTVDTNKVEDSAAFFRWAFTRSDWARTHSQLPVVVSAMDYLDTREAVRAELARRIDADPKWPRSMTAVANQDLYTALMARRAALETGSLAFTDWVKTYFRSDDISIGRESVAPQLQEVVP